MKPEKIYKYALIANVVETVFLVLFLQYLVERGGSTSLYWWLLLLLLNSPILTTKTAIKAIRSAQRS